MAKIMIIEDEKALNDAYAMILKKQGHKIAIAFNGQEALEMFDKENPDLLLLDLRMPKMDGVEFLKKLDSSKKYPKLKIIIFSNYDDQDEIAQAFKHGAGHYILKAWSSPAQLVKIVSETLSEKASSKL